MATPISLIGISTNDYVPGVYIQTDFAAGAASSGGTAYTAIILGNKLSAGSATEDTVIYGPDTSTPMTSVSDAEALFGHGSELARGVARFMAVNKSTSLYALAVKEGTSAVAAKLDITLTGTATSAGMVRIYVGDEFTDAGFIKGDLAADVATLVAAQVNAKQSWAVSAVAVSGKVTLTAKNKGLRGNDLRAFTQVSGTGIASDVLVSTKLAGGTVSDDVTTALATMLGKRFYYIITPFNDATNLGKVSDQIAQEALPINGRRQRMFAGTSDTLANSITLSTGLNSERSELVWSLESDLSSCELASYTAGVYSLEEAQAVPRCNFAFYGQTPSTSNIWRMKAPNSAATPTRSQVSSALNSGLTPIVPGIAGSTSISTRVTTRFLSNGVTDYRIREASKVTIEDFFADDLVVQVYAAMDGKLIQDDPISGAPEPAPNVATPRNLKAVINGNIRDYFDKGLLENPGQTIADTIVQREASPANRMSARIPLQTAFAWTQSTIKIEQIR